MRNTYSYIAASFIALTAAASAEAAPKFYSCLAQIYSREYRIQLDEELGKLIVRQVDGQNKDLGEGDRATGGYRAVRTANSNFRGWTIYEGIDAMFSSTVIKPTYFYFRPNPSRGLYPLQMVIAQQVPLNPENRPDYRLAESVEQCYEIPAIDLNQEEIDKNFNQGLVESNYEQVKAALAAGANPNISARGPERNSVTGLALSMAVRGTDPRIVDLLLDHPKIDLFWRQGRDRETALHAAVDVGNLKAIDQILSRFDKFDRQRLINREGNFRWTRKWNALSYAVNMAKAEKVPTRLTILDRLLREMDPVSINNGENFGFASRYDHPLSVAAGSFYGSELAVQRLLDAGADPMSTYTDQPLGNFTALFEAITNLNLEAVRLLMPFAGNPNRFSDDENNLMKLTRGCFDGLMRDKRWTDDERLAQVHRMIDLLLSYPGTDINATRRTWAGTALDEAEHRCDRATVEYLRSRGAKYGHELRR